MPYEDNDISLYMTIGFNDNDVGGRLLKVISKAEFKNVGM